YIHENRVTLCVCRLLYAFTAQRSRYHLDLHSFPTRRSSDLKESLRLVVVHRPATKGDHIFKMPARAQFVLRHHVVADIAPALPLDRKSTRLNSSHVSISYAVFCL